MAGGPVSVYDELFYDDQEKGSYISAKIVVPLVMDIINPESVMDVGCGLGTWLSVFSELGVTDILGLDGDWVDKKRLHIPKDKFTTIDLENPSNINRRFDLVVSLEVGEHISKENSENYVKYLIDKSQAILFSAAIPFQGGTNHINEQWPEYWIEIFKKYNYEFIDCLRAKIWDENEVEWWYIQNIFLVVEKNHLQKNKRLKDHLAPYQTTPTAAVHPRLYLKQVKINENFKKSVDELKIQNWDYEDQLKFQKKSYDEKIQVLEKQKVDSFGEIKGLLDELKGQKLVYEGQLEGQRQFYDEKIQVLEKQNTKLFNEFKSQKQGYFNQLKSQKDLYKEKLQILEKENNAFRVKLKSKEQLINDFRFSNSWKLTKPFRKLGRLIRN